MNVYDFDQTIYHGDSTVDFYLYCVRHRPLMIYSWPGTAAAFVLYQAKIINKTQFKRQMYQFLRAVGDTEQLVEKFWDSHIKKIKSWYRNDTQRADRCHYFCVTGISAAPLLAGGWALRI